MQRYIAFLRGINLGNRRLPMSRLKDLFEALDFDGVETFIASGNVLFGSKVMDTMKLERRIAGHLELSLGYAVDTFLRSDEDVVRIGNMKVFPQEGQAGLRIHVGFFQEEIPPETSKGLAGVRTAYDEFRVDGREYFWLCRGPTSESQVWKLPEVKALRLPTSTLRNMTSIRKLIVKHLTQRTERTRKA